MSKEKERNRGTVQKLDSNFLNFRLNYNTLQYCMVLHQDIHAVASNSCFLNRTSNFSEIYFCFFSRDKKVQVLDPSQLSLGSSSEYISSASE